MRHVEAEIASGNKRVNKATDAVITEAIQEELTEVIDKPATILIIDVSRGSQQQYLRML